MSTLNLDRSLLNNLLLDAGINEIPPSWEVKKLEDLLASNRSIAVGVMYPGKHTRDGVPLIKVGDFSNGTLNQNPDFRISHEKNQEYHRTTLQGGELLLTLVGDLGQCAIVPPHMKGWNAARAIAVIKLQDPEDALFVRLFLLSPALQHLMKAWANTTVQPTLNLKEIRQLPILWPPVLERRRIAEILGRLDDKIEVNRRINRTLESMAQALYQHWFVDFGPFQDGEFVESELGPIPVGWRVGKLGDLANVEKNTVDPQNLSLETPYIGLADMPKGSITLDMWGQAKDSTSTKFRMQAGQILFGKLRPYFKKVGVAPVDGVCSTDIYVVVPKQPEYYGFVLSQLIQQEFIDYTEAVSDGTRMPRVNWSMMAKYPVAVPNRAIFTKFNQLIKPWTEIIVKNVAENQKLAAIRDYLLPKLLSGEVPVLVAEEMVFDH